MSSTQSYRRKKGEFNNNALKKQTLHHTYHFFYFFYDCFVFVATKTIKRDEKKQEARRIGIRTNPES